MGPFAVDRALARHAPRRPLARPPLLLTAAASPTVRSIVHSWLELACIVPFEFVCACPPGYEPNADLVQRVKVMRSPDLPASPHPPRAVLAAGRSRRPPASPPHPCVSRISVRSPSSSRQDKGVGTASVVVGDPVGAVKGADAVYADVWASMQNKAEAEERARIFKPYQVNEELMAATGKSSSIFLHCLPAERGKETTDGVMESPNSHIFQQAENRMHAQNAIMVWAMGAARP